MLRHVMPTVGDALPDFCAELTALVAASKRPDLAPKIAGLPLVDRCGCRQDNCAQFYTAPRPRGGYGPKHFNLLVPTRGLVVLDVVGDDIVGVEVLDRADVKAALDAIMPTGTPTTRRS